ncbi:hypothetical protein F0L46_04860 [Salinarimonas soli]|uniref:Uncharacterized protein n=1 Tax=Salinarimonas soli TaxID=1638099 RepID=A0A5B2VPT2_9HYPH|nr:hypothetical protein F0L46_04860 [Salinarimonas soli]
MLLGDLLSCTPLARGTGPHAWGASPTEQVRRNLYDEGDARDGMVGWAWPHCPDIHPYGRARPPL